MIESPVDPDTVALLEMRGSLTFASATILWLMEVTGESARGEISDIAEYLARRLQRISLKAYAQPDYMRCVRLVEEIRDQTMKSDMVWSVLHKAVKSRLLEAEACARRWV